MDEEDGTSPGFWVIDTLYSRYNDPVELLNSMTSPDQFFRFIVDLAGKRDSEMLWEVWNNTIFKETGFKEFKDEVMGTLPNSNDSDTDDNVWASEEELEELLENSEWEFYSLEELDI